MENIVPESNVEGCPSCHMCERHMLLLLSVNIYIYIFDTEAIITLTKLVPEFVLPHEVS